LLIAELPCLGPGLGGIDLYVCQHGRFPVRAGSIRGHQKGQHFVVAADAHRRISPDDVWRFFVEKCCEASPLLDNAGRIQRQ
jgi:hypothetical protein